MRLTIEEVREINLYLTTSLRKKGFEVRANVSFSYIKNVIKFGIRCVPGICHSKADGKQEFSFLCLAAGKTDPSDLGFYQLDEFCALNKYSQSKTVKIDLRTYERVIDEFVKDLTRDYMRIHKQYLKESKNVRVIIKNTGDVFEGKDGILESETEDAVTVWVNFDDKGHKIKQTFKRDAVDISVKETLIEDTNDGENLETTDEPVELGVHVITDERLLLLAGGLHTTTGNISKPYEDDPHAGFLDSNTYDIEIDDGQNPFSGKYYVLTEAEALKVARENFIDEFEAYGFEDFYSGMLSDVLNHFLRLDVINRDFAHVNKPFISVSEWFRSNPELDDAYDFSEFLYNNPEVIDMDKLFTHVIKKLGLAKFVTGNEKGELYLGKLRDGSKVYAFNEQ